MCISTPKITATPATTPAQLTASNLELGTDQIQQQQAGILGRLALTSRPPPKAGQASGGTSTNEPGGSVSNANTSGSSYGFGYGYGYGGPGGQGTKP